eukprot:3231182-Rhodomonas_salina.2
MLGAEGVRDFVVDVAEASQEMLGDVGVGVFAVDMEVASLRSLGAEGVVLSSIYLMLSEITPTTPLTDTRKKVQMSQSTTLKRMHMNKDTRQALRTRSKSRTAHSWPSSPGAQRR